ncbi:Golgi SNAP receptor complex member 1, partial [Nowakowskiella sp. JEL0078]
SNLNISENHWENLRKQARQLENDIESRLVSFSRSGGNITSGSTFEGSVTEHEIDEVIKKLSNVVNSMASHLENVPSSSQNSSMMHILQRHRDIFYDYSKEFSRTKAKILAAREHAELLDSIRNDIEYDIVSYKSGSGSNASDYLLTERGKIDSSHRMTDMVL